MKGATTEKDLFDAILKVMVDFIHDFILDYKLLRGIIADGAPLMMGNINGLAV